MCYYLRDVPGYKHLEAWKIDDHVAVRVGVPNAEYGAGTYFKAEPGGSVWDAIRKGTPWFGPDGHNPFVKAQLAPGFYYPRIARPLEQHPQEAPGWSPGATNEANSIAIARSQLAVLTRQLDRICQTVHPTKQTLSTFGHDIRNLLILACTEVEAHWRGVLVANAVRKDRYQTKDYVKLAPVMKLNEYAVKFPSYPWLDPVKPFKDWGKTGKPTKELSWYDAYNAVKHDRESKFEAATLSCAFEAISACFVMLAAQFGLKDGLGQRSEILAFFQFCSLPLWSPSDVYIFPYGEASQKWSPTNFNFGIGTP